MLPAGSNLISAVATADSYSAPSTAEYSWRRLCARAWSCEPRGYAPCLLSVERFSRRDLQFLMECVAGETDKRRQRMRKKSEIIVGDFNWAMKERKRDYLISVQPEFCAAREREFKRANRILNVWLLRCWRELVAAPSAFVGDSLLISVLIRLIFRICKSSLTADCGILNVFAQSRISWTVISAELLSCVLLVNNSSNGSSLMFINSSTCWWSSLVRVIVMGTETTELGVAGDGGTSCVLLVIMIVSLALRFFKFMFLLIAVIVMSLFSISFRI